MSAAPTLPPLAAQFLPLLAACEARLATAVAGYAETVATPAAQTLAAGGKRVRPLLVFCCAPTGSLGERSTRDRLLSAAAAVELMHMATLVHDDVLDGATLRRGRPTVAAQYGSDRAVQAGDFLFARAFGELTATGSAAAVRELAAAALDLSRGELEQGRAAFDFGLTEEDYLARCRRKTGALFAVACRVGALVGGAGLPAQERLGAFGERVGLAFQIFDDILDITGSPGATGKRPGTDLRDGTVTLPLILAMRHEPGLRAQLAGARSDADRAALCERLSEHPGLADARERALGFIEAARQAVSGEPVDGADVGALIEIADGVVDRLA